MRRSFELHRFLNAAILCITNKIMALRNRHIGKIGLIVIALALTALVTAALTSGAFLFLSDARPDNTTRRLPLQQIGLSHDTVPTGGRVIPKSFYTAKRRDRCGGTFITPLIGMTLSHAQDCVAPFKFRKKIERASDVVNIHSAGSLYVTVRDGRIIASTRLRP